MTLEELLELGLEKEVAEKVVGMHKDVLKDDYVPMTRFNEVNNDKKAYKGQIDTLNTELGKLKGKLEDNDDANQTIKDLQQDIKDKEKEMESIRKSNAIKLEVLKANPNDVADIIPHLKDDDIVIGEDGTVKGLKEQLEGLKENKGYLFKVDEPKGTGGSLGAGIKGSSINDQGSSLQSIMEKANIRNN